MLAYAYKGDALTGLKRYAEALAAWDGALALSPTFVAAWINKGAILRALGRVAEAEVAEQQARELGDGAASPSL